MAAAGILVNWAGSGNTAYALCAPTGSDRPATASEDFTITFWARFVGSAGGGPEGHRCLVLTTTAGDWIHIYGTDVGGASPWNFVLQKVNFGTNPTTSSVSIAQATDRFFGVTWNHTTNTMTLYTVIDEGTLASASWTEASSYTIDGLRMGARSSDPTGSYFHARNLKVWKTLLDSTGVDAERNSEAPVSTTNLVGDFRLTDASTLTNTYGGAGAWPTISLVQNGTGTVTDGSMDPVDIQAAAASDVFIEGFQNLGNGFKQVTAAGIQGVLVT